MECYPEEEEELPLVEEDDDDDDSGEESDDSDQDLERDIVIRGQRPHQFEPLARNRADGEVVNDGVYRNQRRNTDQNRLENNEWLVCFWLCDSLLNIS